MNRKKFRIQTAALVAAGILVLGNGTKAQDEAAADPSTVSLNFDAMDAGPVGDDVAFVVEGNFSVASRGDNKVLEVAPAPLAESGALVGANIQGDVEISAKVHATKRGRSYPRFGIGTHGMSGYRLRVVPARKMVELFYRDEQVAEAPFAWESDQWFHLKLSVKKGEGESWSITGKVWAEGGEEPEEPTISDDGEDLRGKGKASVWGTPYSGTAIAFDDISVTGMPAP